MNRTMRVKGKGNIKVKPDMTRVSLSLSSLHKKYNEALDVSAENSNLLRQIVIDLGFGESDLKTVNFEVVVQNENYTDRNNKWRTRFAGYKVNHNLKIEFENDNDLLGRLLGRIVECPANPEFSICFFVKDTESAKNMLLGNAVKDAKAKAIILSESAGVRLGDIINLDYSWGEVRFESAMMPMVGGTPHFEDLQLSIDIKPDDVDVTDTVTVEWEIR